jgi:hypothetical protein
MPPPNILSGPDATAAARQSANAVMMVRPASFGSNPQTQGSNRFQHDDPAAAADANARAREEFDGLLRQLQASGVAVAVVQDTAPPQCPDAVFPNNWVTLHADGTVVLYPMLARNRRLERQLDRVTAVVESLGRRITRLLDFSHHEIQARCLEGTGSIVFDHVRRVAYACLSPRTDLALLHELCAELDYEPCAFRATDAAGVPIYHTNVMLAIGTGSVVVAAEAIDGAERDRVLQALAAGGRQVELIDRAQMAGFAGNVLELQAADGGRVLALSQSAHDALGSDCMDRLAHRVDRCVVAPIPTIERLGGGSVRCMLAEVFLPPAH